jgi:hypothetical protein
MGLARLFIRRRQRVFIISLVVSLVILWNITADRESEQCLEDTELQQEYPLLWKHVQMFNGSGGGGCPASGGE